LKGKIVFGVLIGRMALAQTPKKHLEDLQPLFQKDDAPLGAGGFGLVHLYFDVDLNRR
jgi:hypothetical protein